MTHLDRFKYLPFNSRPHKEVDPLTITVKNGNAVLSTHDLTRRSTELVAACISFYLFQLTTSQGGRQALVDIAIERLHLSTHDLTRRSTLWIFLPGTTSDLSTHDLTRRSTAQRGCISALSSLSTHDLTRRSTWGRIRRTAAIFFQLTTSQGGRR